MHEQCKHFSLLIDLLNYPEYLYKRTYGKIHLNSVDMVVRD